MIVAVIWDLDMDGGKLVEYRCFRIPGMEFYLHGRNPRVRQWFGVKLSSIFFKD